LPTKCPHHNSAPHDSEDKEYFEDMANDHQGDDYAVVENAVEWYLIFAPSLEQEEGHWVCEESDIAMAPGFGLYMRGHVEGDYNHFNYTGRHRAVIRPDTPYITVEVVATASGEVDRTLYFDTTEEFEIPMSADGPADADSVLVRRSKIELVLKEGETCRVK
jgi:hypothetical protein